MSCSAALHLPSKKFTLTDLQRASGAVLGTRLDKGAFRRLIKDEPSLRLLPREFFRDPQRSGQLFEAAPDFRFGALKSDSGSAAA